MKNKNNVASKTAVILAGVLLLGLSGCADDTPQIDNDQITVTVYDGVEIEAVEEPDPVTDEDVEEYLEEYAAENPVIHEITDREVADGDIIYIDYVGTMGGEEFEGGSAEDTELEIGSGMFIDGFEDSIIGHMPGDTFVWDGTFPEDYGNDYAGKDVSFTITVNYIADMEDRKIDDDFAKEFSENSDTLDGFREEVREYLEAEQRDNYKDSVNSVAWNAVMDNTTVKEYDEDEVQEMTDEIVEQYKAYAEYYGTTFDEFLATYMGYDSEDAFMADAEESARQYQEEMMVVNTIADQQKIKIDDYDAEALKLANSVGYETVEELEAVVDQDAIDESIITNLVIDWVGDHCVQVEPETIEIDDLESSTFEED